MATSATEPMPARNQRHKFPRGKQEKEQGPKPHHIENKRELDNSHFSMQLHSITPKIGQ